MTIVELRHVKLSEIAEVWHIWVIGQATQRGWMPTIHPPHFHPNDVRMVAELNEAVDFLVEYSSRADSPNPHFVMEALENHG